MGKLDVEEYGTYDSMVATLLEHKFLPEKEVLELCERARSLISEESNVHSVRAPVTVVGDIHGQFHDLLEMFKLGGYAPDTNYLFLGDYVDRRLLLPRDGHAGGGAQGSLPRSVTIIRGNHESRQITQVYGFYDECMRKYGHAGIWKAFTDLFDYLPLAAVIENQIFCPHGGLSPSPSTRWRMSASSTGSRRCRTKGRCATWCGRTPTTGRGGNVAARRGLHVRTGHHRAVQPRKRSKDDRACAPAGDGGISPDARQRPVTIFSAPNYCYRCGNQAAIMEVSETMDTEFLQFDPAPRRGEERGEEVPGLFPLKVGNGRPLTRRFLSPGRSRRRDCRGANAKQQRNVDVNVM